MSIRTFSNIDLYGTQIKTSRVDNINDVNLLNFEGQIAFDTTDDKLKYKNSTSVDVVASESRVLGQSFSVNLTNGNGTVFNN